MTTKEAKKYIESYVGDGSIVFIHQAIRTEVLKKAISALKKQIPMKPREYDLGWCCPNCGVAVMSYHSQSSFALRYEVKMKLDYCASCGQAIDWSEE